MRVQPPCKTPSSTRRTKAKTKKVGRSRSWNGRVDARRTTPATNQISRVLSTLDASQLTRIGILKETTNDTLAFVDLDGRRYPRFGPIWAVCRIAHIRPTTIRCDRTRHGWHLVIRFTRRLLPAELVAFQACVGSDPRREALNLMRVIAIRTKRIRSAFWRRRWNLLYAAKL